MRIYVHYESTGAPPHTMKLKVSPGMSVALAVQTYVASYAEKHSGVALPEVCARGGGLTSASALAG